MKQKINSGKLKIFIMPIMMILGIVFVASDFQSNIVGYWNFDASNLADDSQYGVTGSAAGQISFPPGIVENAVTLNGTGGYINFFPSPINLYNDTKAVQVWVYPNSTNSNMWIATNSRDGFSEGWRLRFNPTNILQATYATFGSGDCLVSYNLGSDPSNMWTHIVLNKVNDTNLELWINGTRTNSSLCSGAMIPANTSVRLGEQTPGVGSTFNGTADEFALWSQPLTPADIVSLWNDGAGMHISSFFAVSLRDEYLDASVNVFNATINGTFYSTTNGTINTPINQTNGALVNITLNAQNYISNTFVDINTSTGFLTNLTYVVPRHQITAFIAPANVTAIENFTVTDNLGFSETTTNGSILYEGVWNTSTTITINPEGYQTANHTFNNTVEDDKVFYLEESEIFNIFIYDETRYELIDWTNITLEIINPGVFSENITVDNGSAVVDMVVPGNYRIRYFDTNQTYFERNYYLTLVDGSIENIDLFLLNKSYPNNFDDDGSINNVLDTVNNRLEGAILIVTKYFSQTNDFETVERLETNFDGQARSYYTSDGFYRFLIQYQNQTVYSSGTTQIFEEPLTFIVELGEDPTSNFFNQFGIDYTLNYVNSTSQFVYTYNDINRVSSNNCLRVYRLNDQRKTLEDQSCSTSTAGTIFVTITPQNYTYIGEAYATLGGNESLVASKTILLGFRDYLGQNGWYLLLILSFMMAAVGIWNLVLAIGLLPLPLLLFSVIGAIPVPVPVGLSITLACWVVAVIVARRS